MEIEKFHNLSNVELAHEERKSAEQLFRLRFQMRMGQGDGLQKLRGLRKDVARIQTVTRQRELGLATIHAEGASHEETKTKKAAKPAHKAKKAAKPAVKKAVKKTAGKKTAKPKKAAAKSKAKKESR